MHVIFSEKQSSRIFKIKHRCTKVSYSHPSFNVNYHTNSNLELIEKIENNPHYYIWSPIVGPMFAGPAENTTELKALSEKIDALELLWESYIASIENTIVEVFGDNLTKEIIDLEMSSGMYLNPDSFTHSYIKEKKLTIESFEKVYELCNKMIDARKISTFRMIKETQNNVMTSDNPNSVIQSFFLRSIYPK